MPTLDARLKDPESGNADQQPAYVLKANPEYRSIKPEVSVLVGLCTHLGCSPEMVAEIRPEPYDAQWKGGYFCPCHKSRFDMSGRVFQDVPAPINLLVPPHHYTDDNTIVIGVDPQGAA
ncbi:Ubiquinol-cytochrome c reductase iron-sulfur subunit [compost metagenome]